MKKALLALVFSLSLFTSPKAEAHFAGFCGVIRGYGGFITLCGSRYGGNANLTRSSEALLGLNVGHQISGSTPSCGDSAVAARGHGDTFDGRWYTQENCVGWKWNGRNWYYSVNQQNGTF